MPKFRVEYERQSNPKYSYWKYSDEEITARGIVHAHKLATAHLRELRKLSDLPMRIYRITQREERT